MNDTIPFATLPALLYAVAKDRFEPAWYWTSESEGASYAWGCFFDGGNQFCDGQHYEGCAVAVRMIPLTA